MKNHILTNKELTIEINEHGAELSSIKDNHTNQEYMWNADPAYWKRHSPILFPIVGSLKNQSYTYQGKSYPMSQHGFARDMEFTVKHQSDTEIWFRLKATEETKKIYPFDFILEIGYHLTGRRITVMWKVTNQDKKEMYFSIGGHPAFLCPLSNNEKQSNYYISFDIELPIHYIQIDENGLAEMIPIEEQRTLTTENGILSISADLFDHDALIIENHQCSQVSLLTPQKKPYLTVNFNAPLFGLWSPAKKNAPFICIEPWYGRCDSKQFNGSLEDRDWSNKLDAGCSFETSYSIDIT